MTTTIRVLQEQFNEAAAEHDEFNILRSECHDRGDVIGERKYMEAMTESANRAVDTQRQIAELMDNLNR